MPCSHLRSNSRCRLPAFNFKTLPKSTSLPLLRRRDCDYNLQCRSHFVIQRHPDGLIVESTEIRHRESELSTKGTTLMSSEKSAHAGFSFVRCSIDVSTIGRRIMNYWVCQGESVVGVPYTLNIADQFFSIRNAVREV